MKIGDLVWYKSNCSFGRQSDDCTLGIVTSVVQTSSGDEGWVKLIWSQPSGPYEDVVPLNSLEVVNESR